MKNQKCPTCQGELETRQIEKMLKGGNNTAIIHVEAEVCSNVEKSSINQTLLANLLKFVPNLEINKQKIFK